jgi:hypothetical protein
MEHPERLFQLALPDLQRDFAAPRTLDRPRPAPPVPMAGREMELGRRAAELARGLEGLGPAIEERVRASLVASGVPEPPSRRALPQHRRGRMENPAMLLAGFVILVFFVSLVAIVYLVLQAF